MRLCALACVPSVGVLWTPVPGMLACMSVSQVKSSIDLGLKSSSFRDMHYLSSFRDMHYLSSFRDMQCSCANTLPAAWRTFSLLSSQIGPNGGAVPSTFNSNMTQLYGQPSILVIPRFPTRVYFDVSTPLQNEMEFNSFYGPTCYGYNQGG